jgi:DNA repair exonuclease SbcCD nuclease subunit
MIKQIYHISDIHIRTYKYHDEYREQFQKFLDSVKEKNKGFSYRESRIAILGDLFHQKITISNEQLILGSWLLKECAKIAPVVLIAGNHDLLENNSDRIDSITPIVQLLDNENIAYYKDRDCFLDDNIVWCNYSIFSGNERPDIELARTKYGDDKKYLGLYHAPLIGSVTDLGYTIDHGASTEHFKGCDAVLMGDIHINQTFEFEEDGKIIKLKYPSSLVQQGFGEKLTGHGYTIWGVDTLGDTHVEIPNDASFYQFKVTDLEQLEDKSYKLINN